MSGSESSDRKSIRARRKVVLVKTPLRSVSEMEEGMNNTLTMEQQQALEIAMNAEKEEREEMARKEAELKERKKKLFVEQMSGLCAEHNLGGLTGVEELYDQLRAKVDRDGGGNISKCYSDVSEDEESAYQVHTNMKRKRITQMTASKDPMMGIGQAMEQDQSVVEFELTERQKAEQRKKLMLAAPPRDDVIKRINIPSRIKPTATRVATNERSETQVDSDGAVKPTMKSMKGRIRVHKMETQKIAAILEEKKLPVNMKLGRDGSTMVACSSENRLEVIKVLRENGQTGHSYMTKEDRVETRMLKGIDASFGPVVIKEEILDKLKNKGLKSDEFSVDRFETFHSVSNDMRYHMYIVKAVDTDKMNLITSIFGLCNMVCKWEQMKRRDVTQCFNCYEFGHSQGGGCLNMRKCKRCLVVEPNHECKVELVEPTEENGFNPYAKYQCCGCKEYGHPPTHTKCRKYVEATNRAKAAKQARNTRRWEKRENVYIDAPVPTMNSWARPTANENRQQATLGRPSNQGFNMEDEVKAVLGMDATALQRMTLEFIESYRLKTTVEEKATALALYFLKINGWKQ